MLTRIYADNYRCFQNFTFQPKRMSLVVGDNGSGKSCLLEVLQSLKTFAASSTALETDFLPRIRTRWDTRTTQRFELTCEDVGGHSFHWAVVLDEVNGAQTVATETVTRDGSVLADRSRGRRFLTVQGVEVPMPYELRGSLLALDLDEPGLQLMRNFVQNIVLLKLEPTRMVAVSEKPAMSLATDGSNFAAGYRGLRERDFGRTQRLHVALKAALPGFVSLEQEPIGPETKALVVKLSQDEGRTSYSVGFNELSDGQRVLVVLYHVLTGFDLRDRTLFFDEADNFVSLRELQPWLQELRRATEDDGAQALIVSHNAEVIDYLAAEDACLFERSDGGPTRTRPLPLEASSGLKASEQIARGWLSAS